MAKFISAVMSFFTAVLSFMGISVKKDVIPLPTAEEFTPAVRFFVCSDTHISSATDKKLERITAALEFAYNVAENDAEYKNLDAAMFVGDVTDNGKDEQFAAFDKTVKESLKDGTALLAVVAKNHDGYENGKQSLEKIKAITGMDSSDFHVVINGYHFIGLSTSKREGINYAPYQRIWLEKELKKASEDSPDKPIFVFNHEHVRNTVYGSTTFDGWGISYFKDIFARYPQIVHFSGHSHYPLNDPRSVWQGNFTEVGTGSLNYAEFTVDNERSVHPENNAIAQGWIVEADAQNRVRLRGFDAFTGEWLCEYLITNPSDVSTYTLTPYNMEALSSAPEFEEGAKMSVENADGKYNVTVPAAKSTDGKIVFIYRLNVYNKNGIKVNSEYKINNYWTANTYESISFKGVEAKAGYKIEVIAQNAYEMSSKPLCYTVE